MRKYFLLVAVLPVLLLADKTALPVEPLVPDPWLTGPLLAASSVTIPAGHYNIEPYLYATANTGFYNSNWGVNSRKTLWQFSLQPALQFGLTPWMDFQFNPTLNYAVSGGAQDWTLGDMPVLFDFQLYKRNVPTTDWVTAVKLFLKETFPMGKYQKLNRRENGTDAGGEGSFQSAIGLIWGNLIHFGGVHFLSSRLSLQYTIPAPVRVQGLNVYGGGHGTNGTVYPAQNFEIDWGLESTLTQNWALALDLVASWSGRVRFKGNPGTNPNGTTATVGQGSSAQFSLAPAIEYNWSDDLGLIAGAWFTVAGRNSTQFASAIVAFNYYK
ncbi:MAG: hypothetical protein A3E80_00705 [Chlamydiae bacterium RIFCSPHIGHO2_12_FULL_49_9]|nr:MAG: hypothetical protein A3E80_00705 [Chlamydiae bacterium RIFCSPHIGHO2_12_FULL_49_9]